MLDSATLTKGGKAIASNVQLKKVDGTGSLYQLDFMALKPSAGLTASVIRYLYVIMSVTYFRVLKDRLSISVVDRHRFDDSFDPDPGYDPTLQRGQVTEHFLKFK